MLYCANAELKGNLKVAHNKKDAFITTSFHNWKKINSRFESHINLYCHKTALTYESTVFQCKGLGLMINQEIENNKNIERRYDKNVMETVQVLSCQGIPFQGDEGDNFTQIFLLCGKDKPDVAKRLTSTNTKSKKYTHDQYQNELIGIMAQHVLCLKLIKTQESDFYGLIVDEYTDISNIVELTICIWWVNMEELKIYKDFVGFYEIENIESETMVNAIRDALLCFDLPLSRCRGKTYDDASNKMGKKSKVAIQLKEVERKALVTHSHCHSLNLSVKSTTYNCKLLKDTLETVREICTLVKYSPKHEKLLGSIQENIKTDENFLPLTSCVQLDG